MGGYPCDMDPIMSLAEDHGLFVIEDCAQAHGAIYKGRKVGALGHISAFSFCQDKIMTTGGEGGLLSTNNKEFWKKAWEYKDHGKSYDKVFHYDHPPGFRWVHESFGTNWRLTEMQSAIGRKQLEKLDFWIEKRTYNAAQIRDVSKNIPSYVSVRLKLAQSPSITVTLDFPTAQAFNLSIICGCISIIVWLLTPCACI